MDSPVKMVCLAGLLLGACASAQETEQRYAIVAAESDLHWLVYKAGALARLGHNHTIAVEGLSGSAVVSSGDLAGSRFEMEFSVADLVIDDATLRSTLGADFASVPTAADVAGTRANMLSESVLNAAGFPRIRVTGTGPAMRDGRSELAVQIELLGRTVELSVPGEVAVEGERVRAKGEFELNHADLGMRPFSVMMGALQVGEKLTFFYDVTAVRVAP